MSSAAGGTPWAAPLAAALGERIASHRPVPGGDLAESHRVVLASGRSCFVKHYRDAPGPLAACEAEGLAWLGETGALRVPRVLAGGDDWLALEWIDGAPPASDYDVRLGRGLAELHAAGAARFGHPTPGWIGRLPLPNEPCAEWAVFYAERRIRPLQARARDAGLIDATLSRRLDRVVETLPERVGPGEPPARLHGDLWSGNVLPDEHGAPCLIDPAAYGGHREVDLAMMQLFGGFGPDVLRAYHEAWPLAPGADERVPLHQLHPLLVHVCLFGSGYVGSLARALTALGV